MRHNHAIVRLPGSNFGEGITTSSEGAPDPTLTLLQHKAYCDALSRCGLELTILPAIPQFPDGPFVEDTAIMLATGAILTRPGAQSRRGEVESVEAALHQLSVPILGQIQAPGSLDGGDVLRVGRHFFVGLSTRTNLDGTRQLQRLLEAHGNYQLSVVEPGDVLHLKTAVNAASPDTLLAVETFDHLDQFRSFQRLLVPEEEAYAANILRLHDAILMPAGYPKTYVQLQTLGVEIITLEMSEFRKMDGGLTCCSLLW